MFSEYSDDLLRYADDTPITPLRVFDPPPASGAAGTRASRVPSGEILVPLPRPGVPEDIDDLVRSAPVIARERGATLVAVEHLAEYPEATKVVFFGHGNRYVIGRRTAVDLHQALRQAGLNPEVIELAGCGTGGCMPTGVFGLMQRFDDFVFRRTTFEKLLHQKTAIKIIGPIRRSPVQMRVHGGSQSRQHAG